MKVQQAWINRSTLSTRARRGLIAAGCASKEDIYNSIMDGTLKQQHQIGDGTVDEVKNWLGDFTPRLFTPWTSSADQATELTKLEESNNVNQLDEIVQRLEVLEAKKVKHEFLTFDEVVQVWNDTTRTGTLNDMLFDFAARLQSVLLERINA